MKFKELHSIEKKKINNELFMFLDTIKFEETFTESLWIKTKQYVTDGGKRLRPVALVMAYKGISDDLKDIYKAAISTELYHASTLIHDDIMDEDTQRRGKDSVFEWIRKEKKIENDKYDAILFNNKTSRFATTQAILAGNIVNNVAYQPIIDSTFKKKTNAITILIETAKKVNEGQILDTLFETTTPSEDQYLDMILKKTGELFKGSIMIGLELADASEEQKENMQKFAENIALAFQIQDDLMDIDSNSKKGHATGSDIKQGKMTLLAIKALEKNPNLILGEKADIKKTIDFFHSCGAVNYAKELATQKINDGKSFLEKSNLKNESQEYFNGFADFMLKRNI